MSAFDWLRISKKYGLRLANRFAQREILKFVVTKDKQVRTDEFAAIPILLPSKSLHIIPVRIIVTCFNRSFILQIIFKISKTRSSRPQLFLEKSVLKICSNEKLTQLHVPFSDHVPTNGSNFKNGHRNKKQEQFLQISIDLVFLH